MSDENYKSGFLLPGGELRIEQWAVWLEGQFGRAEVPMYGTAAHAKPLVSNGQLGLDLVRVKAGEGFEPHTHPGDHLLICVEGTGTITYDGAIYQTRAGQVYLIEGAIPHAVGAITDHSILAVGAPHRPAGGADRMALTEYDAIAADLGVIRCLICDDEGRANELRDRGCVHAPKWQARKSPIMREDPAPGEVALIMGDDNDVHVRDGALYVFASGDPVGASLIEMADTLAAAGPIEGGDEWTNVDERLAQEALQRMKLG